MICISDVRFTIPDTFSDVQNYYLQFQIYYLQLQLHHLQLVTNYLQFKIYTVSIYNLKYKENIKINLI